MDRVSVRLGHIPRGYQLMKFTLVYDGDLPPSGSNARKEDKWAIRKALDPQLRQLWNEMPDLIYLKHNSILPKDGRYIWTQPHPDHGRDEAPSWPVLQDHLLDVCAHIKKEQFEFLPLVRRTLGLTCGLTVLFLRNEPPGKVYQGGDLDSRVKTLFDALCVPPATQLCEDKDVPTPIHCLCEDDSLITKINIESEKLLFRQEASKYDVRLIVEVDVRVSRARPFNMLFLGD